MLNTAPRFGHGQMGRKPYIVLSHSIIADHSNVATVTPISSTTRDYPLYVDMDSEYEMKTTGEVLLNQPTTTDCEAGEHIFLEEAHDNLVEELLIKARTVLQKVGK